MQLVGIQFLREVAGEFQQTETFIAAEPDSFDVPPSRTKFDVAFLGFIADRVVIAQPDGGAPFADTVDVEMRLLRRGRCTYAARCAFDPLPRSFRLSLRGEFV